MSVAVLQITTLKAITKNGVVDSTQLDLHQKTFLYLLFVFFLIKHC